MSQHNLYDRRSNFRNEDIEQNVGYNKNTTIYNELKDLFPSRNTFKFTSGMKITSNFDAGNLMYCKELEESQTHYTFNPE